MADLLSDEEIRARLPEGWTREGDEIVRLYEFDEYLRGAAFVSEIAEIADEEFHHPEIRLRYDEVEVRLTSHEEGGITSTDIELASSFETLR